eukprot:scaffold204360_cov14-Tisochrysis_lutea.AAC.1
MQQYIGGVGKLGYDSLGGWGLISGPGGLLLPNYELSSIVSHLLRSQEWGTSQHNLHVPPRNSQG